ncbi:GntR family transcriptional regulator [Frigidibacter sp. ROC022]|uniref:GntR family transcriptional regulator n=1 Tax=Frigidibacter sp. ROC022 TaxID=2971796 RepID=UPI00215A520F|nr:GntR family transcriptional regulator [Frigidibacter sp. ROC022]
MKQVSNTQRAVDELRRLIFSGELGAGSDHLESELAERLGMSRTPIREAALILEAQGLVEMRPRKGLRVLALSPSDMRDIYDVLTELESLSAENAARLGYSDEELRHLATAISDMEEALERKDLEAWAKADDAFHAELVRLGRNSRVQAIAGMMVDQVRRAKAMTLQIRPLPVKSNEDHRGVFEAIRSGNAAEARRIHYAHRTHAKTMLLELLEKYRFLHL